MRLLGAINEENNLLAIVNVTKCDGAVIDDYEIRINKRVIGRFQHTRTYGGAAQCLRDAADALDADTGFAHDELLQALLPVFLKRMQDT